MDELEHLLQKRAAALTALPAVPDELMARILADAARAQPRSAMAAKSMPTMRLPTITLGQVFADLFGGGGVLAGMATAACAGIYLGLAQPSALSALTLAFAGPSAVDQLDFMPNIDRFLAEE